MKDSDTLNRVSGIDHKRSGTSLFTAYSDTYDRMDRITGITSQDGTVAYTYDKTSQLTGADYSYQTDETFTWDANGNPTMSGYTVATNNRLTSDGTYNYTYDDEGNQTRRTKISDSSYTDYTWDHRNRLTNVTNKTSGGTSTMSADYTYDLYDRRIKKIVDADGAGGGGSVTTRYVYEDHGITRVVLQFDGSSNLTHRYLHGPAVDQLLADEDSSNALLWPLTDHLGSVRDEINNSGTTQNHLKYGSFGDVTAESASAVDFLMGFAGMDRDEETGVNYSWHRSTLSGRWLTPDPDGFDAGDTNLSRYVNNSPINACDPKGLMTVGVSGAGQVGIGIATFQISIDFHVGLDFSTGEFSVGGGPTLGMGVGVIAGLGGSINGVITDAANVQTLNGAGQNVNLALGPAGFAIPWTQDYIGFEFGGGPGALGGLAYMPTWSIYWGWSSIDGVFYPSDAAPMSGDGGGNVGNGGQLIYNTQ